MIKLDYSKQIGKKIVIQERSKSTSVEIVDITHVSCDEHVCTVHLVNDPVGISTVYSLDDFEKEMQEYGGFTRTHHNRLVNDKHFKGTRTAKGKKYVKVHDTEIAVSKRKKGTLFK